jgi:GrpB-like predicted nucleotidyltransferase (UPF0157 family)
VTTHPLWRPPVPEANAARQGQRVASRQVDPGPLRDHDPGWGADFARVERIIREAISEHALAVHHVGSTAVPGLLAKPVIDVDLTVSDVEDEPSYLPQLQRAGFRLIFRDEMAGDAHRHLTLAEPNTNLHVWSPDAVEPRRHLLFTAWLRSSGEDRRRYNGAKAAAVAASGSGRYNDLKAAVVHEIYDRAFAADLQRSGPERGPAPR